MKDPTFILETLKQKYPIHSGSNNLYLGGDVTRKNGHTFLSGKTYISNTCKKIEKICNTELKHYDSPMATDDHPELDDSMLLNEKDHSIYRLLIGCAQWIITLGRFDIHLAVSTLSRFSQSSRQGQNRYPTMEGTISQRS